MREDGSGSRSPQDPAAPGSYSPEGLPAGRMRLALVLLVLGVGAGAVLDGRSREALYRAQGLIHVAPSMPSPQDPAGISVLPMFEGFMSYQVQILESPRTTRMALEAEAWRKTGAGVGPDAFEARRQILRSPGMQHIEVGFTDASPTVALAGVHALLEAYRKLAVELNAADDRMDYAREQVELLTGRIKSVTDQMLQRTLEVGGREALEVRHRAGVERLVEAEEVLEDLREQIRPLASASADSPELAALRTREEALVGRVDALRAKAHEVGRLHAEVDRLAVEKGDMERRLAQMRALSEQLASELVGRGRITVPDFGSLPTAPCQAARFEFSPRGAALGALPGLLLLPWLARRGRRGRRSATSGRP